MLRLDLRLEEGEAPNPPTAATTKREREEGELLTWFVQRFSDEGGDLVPVLSFGSARSTNEMMQQVRVDLAHVAIAKGAMRTGFGNTGFGN